MLGRSQRCCPACPMFTGSGGAVDAANPMACPFTLLPAATVMTGWSVCLPRLPASPQRLQIRLITLLVRLDELPGENVKEVYRLLGDQSHGIRHAAADLVASMLEEQGRQALEQAAAPGGGGRGSARKKKGRGGGAGGGSSDASGSSSPAELQLAGLLALQQALAVEQGQPATGAAGEDEGQAAAPRALARGVVAQVVDALFEGVPALGDWKLMVQWLQQDRAQELFGEAGVTNLASTLQATLVKATGGELLKDAAPLEPRRGAHMGRERQQAQAAARQEATLVLLKELPSLLRKVQTHPEQVRGGPASGSCEWLVFLSACLPGATECTWTESWQAEQTW